MALWQARSPVDLLGFGSRAIVAGVAAQAALAAELMHLGPQLFGAGLAPIHRTATRNARPAISASRREAGKMQVGFAVASPTSTGFGVGFAKAIPT